MNKIVIVIAFVLLLTGCNSEESNKTQPVDTSSAQTDSTNALSPANPLHPIHPANPANPASPLNRNY